MAKGVVTLTSDFGRLDGYVGVMHGVLARVHPDVRIVDLVHEVAPQDIVSAAFHLRHAWRHFAPGTVHVAVVDPGVGTDRRILVRAHGGHVFLAPDNGLLPWALGPAEDGEESALDHERLGREVAIGIRSYEGHDSGRTGESPGQAVGLGPVSRTFHGRDLFAPAAALLASGVPILRISRPLDAPSVGAPAGLEPYREAGHGPHDARIVHIDRFGNAVTTWTPADPFQPRRWRGAIADRTFSCASTYAEVAPGEPLALLDSFGHVEVAVRNGDAAHVLGLRIGDRVRFEPAG